MLGAPSRRRCGCWPGNLHPDLILLSLRTLAHHAKAARGYHNGNHRNLAVRKDDVPHSRQYVPLHAGIALMMFVSAPFRVPKRPLAIRSDQVPG